MPSNVGSQIVTIKYGDPLNSPLVNARHLDVRARGIYSGGHLRIVNNVHPGATVSLTPLICEIGDDTYQVKVETQSLVTPVAVTTTNVYVVLRWTYASSSSADYMDFIATSSPATNDLIVGKCNFSGNTLTGFDYSERNDPDKPEYFLKVNAPDSGTSEPMKLWVKAGRIHTNSANFDVAHQKTPASFTTPGVGDGTEYGLVYITDAGIVAVVQNDDNASAPSYANKRVIAEIAIPASTTTITQSMIKDVRNFVTRPTVPDGSSIERSATGLLQVKARGVASGHIALLGVQNSHINSNVVDGTTIEKDGTSGKLQVKAGSRAVLSYAYSVASGVAPSAASRNAWTKFPLNTEVIDTGSLGSLASNQITLAAGTYTCEAFMPSMRARGTKLRLRDTTGGTTLVIGLTVESYSGINESNFSTLSGAFTIGVQSVLELQYYFRDSDSTAAFSNASSTGENEVYGVITFQKT